jgi:hypothetical protein
MDITIYERLINTLSFGLTTGLIVLFYGIFKRKMSLGIYGFILCILFGFALIYPFLTIPIAIIFLFLIQKDGFYLDGKKYLPIFCLVFGVSFILYLLLRIFNSGILYVLFTSPADYIISGILIIIGIVILRYGLKGLKD